MFKECKCAYCGKIIIRRSFADYTYKRGTHVYCGWNCYRKDDVTVPKNTNTCVCCGKEIPEGRQVCKDCEQVAKKRRKRWIY